MLDIKHIKRFREFVGSENVYSDRAHLLAYCYDATSTTPNKYKIIMN